MDKIICVGKNYLKHALELGDTVPEEPTYFMKPPSSIHAVSKNGEVVRFPNHGELHHEIELVFRIQKPNGGKPTLSHYTFGVDLTFRDLQTRLKKAGQPWEKAKVFENSAILGPWRECMSLEDVMDIRFKLSVNGKVRQSGVGHHMRWQPEFLLEDLQRWFPIQDGDILFTGTPEGVGPLVDGDLVELTGGNIAYTFRCGTTLV